MEWGQWEVGYMLLELTANSLALIYLKSYEGGCKQPLKFQLSRGCRKNQHRMGALKISMAVHGGGGMEPLLPVLPITFQMEQTYFVTDVGADHR